MSVMIFTEEELRCAVGFEIGTLNAVERGFAALAGDGVSMPPVMHIAVGDGAGDIDVKGAFIPGFSSVAVKIASGFFGNGALGLPSSSAMMVVLSAHTGRCEAILLDNGYLTDLRTGLAGAVAARHLAPAGRLKVGVIGAGVQARYQVEALTIEDRVASVTVYAPRTAQAERYAEDISEQLGLSVRIEGSAQAVAQSCDLLITTTPSRSPLVEAGWLRGGQHVTAMGSDLPGKSEIAKEALRAASLLVVDHLGQSRRIGELQSLDDGDRLVRQAVSLDAIVSGQVQFSRKRDALTICDLTGVGVQDTAIAALAVTRALQAGAGRSIEN